MAGRKNGAGKARGPRKSKAEASTGAKADKAEMRKADALNLGEPVVLKSDDFKLHYRALKSAKERMATAKSLWDGCCKGAKKVSPDLLVAVKRALKWDGLDAEEIKADLEISGFVLKETESSVQLTIHDTLMGDETDLVYKRGFNAGQSGQVLNNQYPEGSELAETFATGWRNGMAANIPGVIATSDRPAGEGHNGGESAPA